MFFLSLKKTLVVTFNAGTPFQKNVAGQGVMIPNLSETLQSYWSHSSFSALEKKSENLSFKSFFYL